MSSERSQDFSLILAEKNFVKSYKFLKKIIQIKEKISKKKHTNILRTGRNEAGHDFVDECQKNVAVRHTLLFVQNRPSRQGR